MSLPSLRSEGACLEILQEILQKRLHLERAYTSSLAAWHTDAHKIKLHLTSGLRDVFLSLVEGAENYIQSRQDMETRFASQIEGVLAATEKLRGYSERIGARSIQLEEFDELARRALEERRLRYEEWKAWELKSVPPNATSGWLRSKLKNSLAPTERTMIDAYNLADMEVRRYVSKAEIAQCSFKNKVIAEVDAISLAYQVAIDAITKCLQLFAEDQHECASNASAGASNIVKVACETIGFRVAGIFQKALASETQDISIASIPYEDLETISRYPTIGPQPIVVGFSLPPYYLSCTSSTKFVVNVFCQLVSFIHENQAWDQYVTQPTPVPDYSLAPTFRDLERSWTEDKALNQDLLRSLGTSTCADLVKTLMATFPEPLIDCSKVPAGIPRLWYTDTGRRPNTTWASPSNQDSEMVPLPLVPPLYNRPQGEMLRALCVSLMPVFKGESRVPQNLFCETFSNLLTRKRECIQHAFPVLVMDFSSITAAIDNRNAIPRPPERISDSPRNTSTAALPTHILPAPPTSTPTSPTTVYRASQDIVQVMSTAVQITPELDEVLFNNNSAGPRNEDWEDDNTQTINDVETLRTGIIKTSRDNIRAPSTILLVGETGIGKSSLLHFIANVLAGNGIDHYDFNILDRTSEQGRFNNQNQTKLARLYEITSRNGVVVRILDTPGLADTRGIEQDELHKKIIATQIEKHIDSVCAVLVLVKVTTIGITKGMDYALSTLSAIFPKTLANNIAVMFTNTQGSACWNLSKDAIPVGIKDAPQFLLGDPIELLRWIRTFNRQDPVTTEVHKFVQAGEQMALEGLVELFDWLGGLEPQLATEIVSLYEKYQSIEAKTTSILDQRDREVGTRAKIDRLTITLKKYSADMDAFSNFTRVFNVPPRASKGQATTTRKVNIVELVDDDMKKKWDKAKDGKERTAVLVAVNELVLHDINQIINCAMGDLVQLVGQYARLSLAGSCSAQVRSAVRLLRQRYMAMDNKATAQDKLEKAKESLGHMKRRLELLSKVEEDAQKGVSG